MNVPAGLKLHRFTVRTPIGPMSAITSEQGLCALEFELPDRQNLLAARIKRWFSGYVMETRGPECAGPVAEWLRCYLNRQYAGTPPLDLRGTEFERKTWAALLTIPPGETTTYGRLAAELHIPRSARAVGTAVRRNPIGIMVPCHRVIGSNGALRGYGGGLAQKKWLLQHEGAPG